MYDIDYRNIRMGYIPSIILFLVGVLFNFLSVSLFFSENQDVLFANYIMLFFSLIPLFFGVSMIINISKKIRTVKKLAKNGILITGLEYKMIPSNISVNNKRLFSIEVEYKLSNGNIKKLVSEPRYDLEVMDIDQKVDLLIDPMNPDSYYVDFEIKKIN